MQITNAILALIFMMLVAIYNVLKKLSVDRRVVNITIQRVEAKDPNRWLADMERKA